MFAVVGALSWRPSSGASPDVALRDSGPGSPSEVRELVSGASVAGVPVPRDVVLTATGVSRAGGVPGDDVEPLCATESGVIVSPMRESPIVGSTLEPGGEASPDR
jgi:hypothetical protein